MVMAGSAEAGIRKAYRRADKRAFALAYLAELRAGRSVPLGYMGRQAITGRVAELFRDEQAEDLAAYLGVCDELNDDEPGTVRYGVPSLGLEDLDPGYVAAAERYANANDRNWPPQVGDLDRAYEDGLTRKADG